MNFASIIQLIMSYNMTSLLSISFKKIKSHLRLKNLQVLPTWTLQPRMLYLMNGQNSAYFLLIPHAQFTGSQSPLKLSFSQNKESCYPSDSALEVIHTEHFNLVLVVHTLKCCISIYFLNNCSPAVLLKRDVIAGIFQ